MISKFNPISIYKRFPAIASDRVTGMIAKGSLLCNNRNRIVIVPDVFVCVVVDAYREYLSPQDATILPVGCDKTILPRDEYFACEHGRN